jgi:hypothetical protein
MPSFQEVVEQVDLPAFFLVRNMEYEDRKTTDVKGEYVAHAPTYDEVCAYVPEPSIRTDPDNLAPLRKRCLVRKLETGSERMLERPCFFTDLDFTRFSTTKRDREIFGETYTIIWVCPPDLNQAVKVLIKEIEQSVKSPHLVHFLRHPDAEDDGRATGFDLLDIWTRYIDRSVFVPEPGEGDTDFVAVPRDDGTTEWLPLLAVDDPDPCQQHSWGMMKSSDLAAKFEIQLAASPYAATPDAWVELNELLMK